MSTVSIRQIAATGEDCGPQAKEIAQTIIALLPKLNVELALPKDVDVVDQDLSPVAHALSAHASSFPPEYPASEQHKLAEQAAYLVRCLRGMYAWVHNLLLAEAYAADTLTSDVNDFTLPGLITHELMNRQLGPAEFGPEIDLDAADDFPVKGFLIGFHLRPMFVLNIKYKMRKVRLPFLVDTGGQNACMNERSWNRLAPKVDVKAWGPSMSASVSIHGTIAQMQFGTGHTQGVNMVGSKWLEAAGVMLLCDYDVAGKGCLLMKATEALRLLHPDLPTMASTVH